MTMEDERNLDLMVAELETENRLMRAKNEALDANARFKDALERIIDVSNAALWDSRPQKPQIDTPEVVVSTTDDFDDLSKPTINELAFDHPLYPVLLDAIKQAMFGKGERHGGNVTPFTKQPWAHYAKLHGRGFLTGQATKKLEEAASTRTGEAFEQEMLGAIVYCGMAILKERGVV